MTKILRLEVSQITECKASYVPPESFELGASILGNFIQKCVWNSRLAEGPRSPLVLRMPMFEFQCKECGKDSELLVRSADWQGERCPSCGSTRLTKKLSIFAAPTHEGAMSDLPACSGNPSACGRCGDL